MAVKNGIEGRMGDGARGIKRKNKEKKERMNIHVCMYLCLCVCSCVYKRKLK